MPIPIIFSVALTLNRHVSSSPHRRQRQARACATTKTSSARPGRGLLRAPGLCNHSCVGDSDGGLAQQLRLLSGSCRKPQALGQSQDKRGWGGVDGRGWYKLVLAACGTPTPRHRRLAWAAAVARQMGEETCQHRRGHLHHRPPRPLAPQAWLQWVEVYTGLVAVGRGLHRRMLQVLDAASGQRRHCGPARPWILLSRESVCICFNCMGSHAIIRRGSAPLDAAAPAVRSTRKQLQEVVGIVPAVKHSLA